MFEYRVFDATSIHRYQRHSLNDDRVSGYLPVNRITSKNDYPQIQFMLLEKR